MAKFQLKPPVFDALQFIGGTANSTTIIEGVAALAPKYKVSFLPAASEYGMAGGAVIETKYTQRLKVEDPQGRLSYASVGDWVIVNRDAEAFVLTNDSFIAQYQPV